MLRFTIAAPWPSGVSGSQPWTPRPSDFSRSKASSSAGWRGVVEFGAGVCNVDEARETAVTYEQRRANHGQPMDLWQVDFSVYTARGGGSII